MPQSRIIANDLDQKRLERVGRFCAVIGCAWLSFGIYYVLQGVWFTVAICAVEVTAAVAAFYLATKYERLRLYVANGYLIISMAGIIVETLGSGLGASTTPHFLCCVGLMAAHQTGIRSATRWTLAIICAQVVIFLILDPAMFTVYRQGTQMEEFLVSVGVTLIIYALSHQAEWSFDRYAKQYIAASEQLRDQAQSLRLAERVAKVGHWRWNAATDELRLSKEAAFICGLDESAGPGYSKDDFFSCLTSISQDQLNAQWEICRRAPHNFQLNLQFKSGNATEYAKYIGFSEVDSEMNVGHIFGVLKDETQTYKTQTELNEKAEALRNLAQFDQLSGLANRHTFRTLLSKAALTANEGEHRFLLLLIDLDGFKEINDTMGHAAGDIVLREVARRFLTVVDDIAWSGSVARLGGDEFTIIIDEVEEERDVEQIAGAIEASMAEPFMVDNTRLRLGASIGAAIYPTDTSDLTELLSFADTAMYEAKLAREGLRRYTKEMTEKIVERRELEAQLQTALRDNEFHYHYQPLFAADGSISGVEALIRWNHQGKLVSPHVFIPYLEASQAILDVGRWGLFSACNQGREWLDAGLPVRISVNISAVQFRHHEFVSCIREVLAATGLPPDLLDIEVTESVVVGNMSAADSTIQDLKELGVHLSIDDFGTGYSSLAYLKHLPFDRLKIDRAFVKDYPTSDDGTLAKTIIVLAHSLNMQVVAEGVETDVQHQFLRDQKCDEFQGYLLSKPQPIEAISELLRSSRLTHADVPLLKPHEMI